MSCIRNQFIGDCSENGASFPLGNLPSQRAAQQSSPNFSVLCTIPNHDYLVPKGSSKIDTVAQTKETQAKNRLQNKYVSALYRHGKILFL